MVGTVLTLEPTPLFYKEHGEEEKKLDWQSVLKYLRLSWWRIVLVVISLLIVSFLQLILPFLTQSVVDFGIKARNIQFIKLVLIGQMVLVFSRAIVEFIRTRLLSKVSIVVNLSILSDFWIKLTKLPLSYFDSRHTGDTLQRIGDNKLVQSFLTGSALNTLFSLLNFVVFGVVLMRYNGQFLLVFVAGNTLYFIWIRLFLHVRRTINYQTFHINAKENNATLQFVQGMQEIRLNNAQQFRRWEWENIQAGIFKLNYKGLTYSQLQQAGALVINQGKDFLITVIAAELVVKGQLTFGSMLAVQYVIGQLSSPIEQVISFVQSFQDAKISMERLNDVYQLEDEENPHLTYVSRLPLRKSILFRDISFAYPGAGETPVLKNINLLIPEGKVTAIVGESGSGKSTLLKLLLKFYESYSGELLIGETDFRIISPIFWRDKCGSVLQDGFVFNDTIARNIAVSEKDSVEDMERLVMSCRMANIYSFVESLPNGFNTQLGSEGVGISQGQKQRLLIARAIYKNPQYLLFDEATNSLDSNNERAIVDNLHEFFKGKTVIVVAHRLSTVKNADKIVVLQDGAIIEEGTHNSLSQLKGRYYQLVKNQLELGN